MSGYRVGAVMMPRRMKIGEVKLVREIKVSVMAKMKAVGVQDSVMQFTFDNIYEVECLHNKGRVVEVGIYKDGTEMVYGEIDTDISNPLNKIKVKFNQPLSGIIVIK